MVKRDPQLLKGVLPILVLTLLDQEESYGYELVTRLQGGGLHGIATGTVHPVLTRLEREGRLSSRLVPSAAGPARKYYWRRSWYLERRAAVAGPDAASPPAGRAGRAEVQPRRGRG